jgi:hypothetical protein
LGSFFALLSACGGWLVCFSVDFGNGMAEFFRLLGLKAKNPSMSIDDWFLIALSLTCAVAAIAFFTRHAWASAPAVVALISIALWAIEMIVVPENGSIHLSWRFDPVADMVMLATAIAGLLAVLWNRSKVATN